MQDAYAIPADVIDPAWPFLIWFSQYSPRVRNSQNSEPTSPCCLQGGDREVDREPELYKVERFV